MHYTLRGKIASAQPYSLDKNLNVEGAAAEAKATGEAIAEAKKEAKNHADNISNPHKVTASQIGLGLVDNTADLDKPVSTAQAEAIADAKKAGTDAYAFVEEVQKDLSEAAGNAQTSADNAQTAADNAQTAADNAQTSADNAQTSADTKATKVNFTASIPASGWSESAPYTQTVAVEGITANDCPHYSVVYSDTLETKVSEKEAFSMVDDLDTADGSVTFTCFEYKPEVDLNIQMEVFR